MTKIEITNLITKNLSKTPITLNDLLGKNVKIDSYEKYVQELSLVKKVFADDIPGYSDEANIYLEKMEDFISKSQTSANIEAYINGNLKNHICGYANSIINPRLILPNSLSNSPERTETTLKQIYFELGEKHLDYYIQLLKTPSQLTSYLSDPNKQVVAMHYILFVTNHHSNTKLSRNISTKNLYNEMNKHLHDSVTEITKEKDDYINFMNKEKDNYKNWYDQSSEKINQLYNNSFDEYKNFLKDSNVRLEAIEKTYSEKLKVEEPSDYMEKKAQEYKKQTKKWAGATIGLSIVLIVLLGIILDPNIQFTEKLLTIHFFSGSMPVYNSVILLSVIALIIYVLKLFVKMTISSKHLSEEYHQKHILTYFYLSLIKDSSMPKEQANIVLATLFAKADTGLIKNDSSGDIESIYNLMLANKTN